MSDGLVSNSKGIRLRHCHECGFLVAFNRFSSIECCPSPETYWCIRKSKGIDDPENIACDRFGEVEKVIGNAKVEGQRRCSECPNLLTWELSMMIDGIQRWVRVMGCSANRGREIRYPGLLRICDEEIESEESTFRITFVAYQTVEVEAEDRADAIRKAWDECELSDAEISDVEEVGS